MPKEKIKFVHREMYERVNFLFQAARLILQQDPTNLHLCRYYIQTMRTVAEKNVIRLHPHMKRSFCKQCNLLLVPGQTSRVRFRSQTEKHTVISCLHCGTIKRFMWRKGYNLWIDNPQAWIERSSQSNKQHNINNCKTVDSSNSSERKPQSKQDNIITGDKIVDSNITKSKDVS